jgi:hypothetical protein
MGRPKKHNADYFPHENGMRNDKKLKAVKGKFGLEGYAVYNMILEILAESRLLIVQWNDTEKDMIAGDFGIDVSELIEMINYFDKIKLIKIFNGFLYCPQLDLRLKPVFDKRNDDLDGLRSKNGVIVPETEISTPETPVSASEVHIVENSIVKKRKGESRKNKSKRFIKPSPQDVTDYAKSIGFNLSGERFCNFYESKDWMIGKNKMKNWKSAVVTWKERDVNNKTKNKSLKIKENYDKLSKKL